MGMYLRPYLALAAMLAIPAKSALATTPVEVARAHELTAPSTTAEVSASAAAPESPLAISGPLEASGSPPAGPRAVRGMQIQLGAAPPPLRDASLLDLSVDVSPQGM